MSDEKMTANSAVEDDFSVEKAFAELEEINKKLNDPATELKDAIAFYKRGVELAEKCKKSLEGIEKELKKIDVNGVIINE